MYRTETLDVDASPMPTLVFEPAGDGPHPGLVIGQHFPVAHEGLEKDPFTIDLGERYAAAGYACVIPFVFHWWPSDAAVATKFGEFRDDRAVADITAARDLLAGLDSVDAARIGILGHCWGGRLAWLGACQGLGFRASVIFYGGRICAALPEGGDPPLALAPRLECPVLGIFGADDEGPSPADVDTYEKALRENDVACEFHRYPGAGHGFQDFTNFDRYRPEASEDAWGKALAFLAEQLGS